MTISCTNTKESPEDYSPGSGFYNRVGYITCSDRSDPRFGRLGGSSGGSSKIAVNLASPQKPPRSSRSTVPKIIFRRMAVPASFRLARAPLLALSAANVPREPACRGRPASDRIEGIRPREAPSLSLHLRHLNACVIISRALISSRQRRYMVDAARALANHVTTPPSPNQSLVFVVILPCRTNSSPSRDKRRNF
jgi:hypothetical protein